MDGIRVDLGKLPGRLPKALRRLGNAATTPIELAAKLDLGIDEALDVARNPVKSSRVKACTVPSTAAIVGVADGLRISLEGANGFDVELLRLLVRSPNGDREVCVRQHVPRQVRHLLAPGRSSVVVLAHAEDPTIAIVDWPGTAEALGFRLEWVTMFGQYDWPERDEWPAVGPIEVRDPGGLGRHRRKLEKRRAEWTQTTAQLVSGSTRGARLDDWEQWEVTLDVPSHQSPVTVKERVPSLAIAKLFGVVDGASSRGGLVTARHVVARVGAPIAVLMSSAGELAVDWEATLRHEALQVVDPPEPPPTPRPKRG